MKKCTKCGKVKQLSEFNNRSSSKDGKRSECSMCQRAYDREWYKRNSDFKKAQVKTYIKRWRKEHPEEARLYYQTRRTMKKALPNTLTHEQWLEILVKYKCKCPIRENTENISLDHFIALNTGHGGTVIGNVYPMNSGLNSSKNATNPFIWMKQLSKKQQMKYKKVIRHLAKLNCMTYKEFKEFTYWCYENPRTVEQVKADSERGLTSIDLWKMSN